MSFPTKLQDARIIVSFSLSPPPLSVFLSSHSHLSLLTIFREVLNFSLSLFSPSVRGVSVYVCISVCLLWCVLQFGTLKQSKIPVGEETQVQSAGGVTTETSWCWQTCLCLSLFFSFMFSLSLSLLFLFLYFYLPLLLFLSVFASLSISISQHIFICNPPTPPFPVHHFLPQGERCSFSLQMWFYFLCGLRSDLWAILPADLAKEMLGQVLSETLQLLVQRYAVARPSYKRHLQIR